MTLNTKSTNVLLLEDDPTIAKTVVYALERAGLQVTHCLLVQDAKLQIERKIPDLLVLDIGLPDGSGLDVCKKMRSHPSHAHIPIIMLSAQSEEIDRVLGLELGADDYVTKPFSPRELVARVNALLRRSTLADTRANLINHGQNALFIEPDSQRATLKGSSLALTRREFGLLEVLLRSPRKIYSREVLLNAVWGADSDSTDRTVDTHIKTLRAKLEQVDPGSTYIETHRGLGYSLSQTPASGSA